MHAYYHQFHLTERGKNREKKGEMVKELEPITRLLQAPLLQIEVDHNTPSCFLQQARC